MHPVQRPFLFFLLREITIQILERVFISYRLSRN